MLYVEGPISWVLVDRGGLVVWEASTAVCARVAIAVASETSTVCPREASSTSIARASIARAEATIWAICVWAELLGELLLLGDSVLDCLLLGSDEVLVLLLLSLHELLALGLSLNENSLLSLTDLL